MICVWLSMEAYSSHSHDEFLIFRVTSWSYFRSVYPCLFCFLFGFHKCLFFSWMLVLPSLLKNPAAG